MKKFLPVLLIVFSIYNCSSQDTMYIEGIVIQRYLKSETLVRLNNEVIREQGKSFKWMIDFRLQSYYFTVRIDSSLNLIDERDIATMVGYPRNYKNVEVFKWLTKNNEFTRGFPLDCGRESLKNTQFFTFPRDTLHVYRVFKLKGLALRTEIENDIYSFPMRTINLEMMGISSFDTSRRIPKFYLYSFINIDKLDCSYPLIGFIPWTKEP